MTVMRLKSNLKTCTFGKTTSRSEEIIDQHGKKHIIRSNTYNTIGEVDINSDFSNLDYLSDDEKIIFKKSIQSQLAEIATAFSRNAAKGIYGGRPVIKSNSNDDHKYTSYVGYISGRKVGEFIGVITDAYDLKNIAIESEENSTQPSIFTGIMDQPERIHTIMEPFFDEVMAYAVTKNSVPKDALSEQQCKEILKLSQQLRELILKGFSWPLNGFSDDLKIEMDDWVREFRSKKNGVIWGKTKKIPVLLTEAKD